MSENKLPIFIILHPRPDWSGYFGAVDFYQGRGSTSSLEDAARLMSLGFMVEGVESRAIVEALIEGKEGELERLKLAHDKAVETLVENAKAALNLSPAWKELIEGRRERAAETQSKSRSFRGRR